jgi:hypothetical protein
MMMLVARDGREPREGSLGEGTAGGRERQAREKGQRAKPGTHTHLHGAHTGIRFASKATDKSDYAVRSAPRGAGLGSNAPARSRAK